MQKKIGGYWLHTMHYSNIPVFLASTKEKYQLNASERFQFGKYVTILTNKFYQVRELMTDFPMQYSKSTSKQFFTRTVFYFFLALTLFVSYWLVTFQKRWKQWKIIQIGLNHFLLKSDHPLYVRIQLWCLVWINESQSWSKNLLHAKKKNGGYWLHTMHYSNILVFVASTKEKKIN